MTGTIKDLELRSFPLRVEAVSLETRAVNGKNTEVLRGRAAVFDEFTEIIDRWGDKFFEKFLPNCMDATLSDGHKIMTLFNHDWSCLMGSTADNLTLEAKPDGLYFEMTPKNFEFDRRIVDFVRSGTIGGCSIGYRIARRPDGGRAVVVDWREDNWYQVVEAIDLYEMSFTPIPAYEQTSVEVEVRKLAAPETETLADAAAPENEERSRILAEMEAILQKIEGGN